MRLTGCLLAFVLFLSACFGSGPQADKSPPSVPADEVRDYDSFASEDARQQAINQWLLDCYEEAGFPSSLTPDGGIYTDVPPDQNDIFDSASTACLEEAIVRFPGPPAPRTREEWAVRWQRQVDTAACLAAEGYEGEVPSLDTYIDRNGEWFAYQAVPEVSRTEWERINRVCPQP